MHQCFDLVKLDIIARSSTASTSFEIEYTCYSMYIEPIYITINISRVSDDYTVRCENDSITVNNVTGCGNVFIFGYWNSPNGSVCPQLSSTEFVTVPCPSPSPPPSPPPIPISKFKKCVNKVQ